MKRMFGCGVLAATLSLASMPLAHAFSSPEQPWPGQRGSTGQHVVPGYLGIDVKDIEGDELVALKLKDTHGAEITRVDHDGPAGKMGLRERDVILFMNGAAIDGKEQVKRMLHESAPGKTIVLVIARDGQQQSVTAQMADLSDVERQAWEQHLTATTFHGPQAPPTGLPSEDQNQAMGTPPPSGPNPTSKYSKSFLGTILMTPSYTGVTLERMTPQLAGFFGVPNGNGLLVRNVENNSPAAMAGIKAGDVVVRANSRNVASMTDWAKTIRDAKGRPVSVVVLRDRAEKSLTLTPDSKKRSDLELPDPSSDGVQLARLRRTEF